LANVRERRQQERGSENDRAEAVAPTAEIDVSTTASSEGFDEGIRQSALGKGALSGGLELDVRLMVSDWLMNEILDIVVV
jgi:hypothetical protein